MSPHETLVNGTGDGHARSIDSFRLAVWLRLHGVDLLTMVAMGLLGLGIYQADPAPTRSFPVYSQDGNIIYPQFAYPLRKEIVPIWAAALIAFFAPFFFFCLFQVRRRSLTDLLDTTMGLLKSLITAAVFQVFLKWLIGGLRYATPTSLFYDVCQPLVPESGQQHGNGYTAIMYDRRVCTGDKNTIDDSLESFPSGHSTAAFAGLVYLSLYLNAQLKVMSAHNPQYWKMILFFAPLLGATLIAGALTIDEYHNWYDVVAGAIIGATVALVAFRQTFASIWDFRFNHLRLPRTSSLFLREDSISSNESQVFTYHLHRRTTPSMLPVAYEGGWGRGNAKASMGAPFDATVLAVGEITGGASFSTIRQGTEGDVFNQQVSGLEHLRD
ncbi:acid phosphatase/Vanadium-dependent haloperoxidase [Ramaria rubella]|nr:acid phosphatase/Vanadium-dependent haloperoxidase [Ramaria rubella]